jgi:hypothetical protein
MKTNVNVPASGVTRQLECPRILTPAISFWQKARVRAGQSFALAAFAAILSGQTGVMAQHELPAPTGPHKTGRLRFHWQDPARDEVETKRPDDKRELMVHLFYPAAANATGARAAYVPDAEDMRGLWNDEQMKRIAAMRVLSVEKAAPLRGGSRFPVVIFAPGGGMKGLIYHALLEDLASHGWVVAAIDPPYNARAVRFPDGRVLGNLAPEERGWPRAQNRDEDLRYYQEKIIHWGRDISFVIDQLTALDRGDGPLAKRLDLARGVGVFGHSRGGQAAGTVRMYDGRVRGGINVDGLYGAGPFQPTKGEGVGGAPPFLWLGKPLPPPPTDEQLQRARRTRQEFQEEEKKMLAKLDALMGSVGGGSLRAHISRPGITHIDFSDEPFWDGSMTTETRESKMKTIEDTRAWVRGFLDGTVRGDWTGFKRLVGEAGKTRPDVTVHSYGKLTQ